MRVCFSFVVSIFPSEKEEHYQIIDNSFIFIAQMIPIIIK